MTYKVPTVGQLRAWVAFLNTLVRDGYYLRVCYQTEDKVHHMPRVDAVALSSDKERILVVVEKESRTITLQVSELRERSFRVIGEPVVTVAPWLVSKEESERAVKGYSEGIRHSIKEARSPFLYPAGKCEIRETICGLWKCRRAYQAIGKGGAL